jgi:hypothetical protein
LPGVSSGALEASPATPAPVHHAHNDADEQNDEQGDQEDPCNEEPESAEEEDEQENDEERGKKTTHVSILGVLVRSEPSAAGEDVDEDGDQGENEQEPDPGPPVHGESQYPEHDEEQGDEPKQGHQSSAPVIVRRAGQYRPAGVLAVERDLQVRRGGWPAAWSESTTPVAAGWFRPLRVD